LSVRGGKRNLLPEERGEKEGEKLRGGSEARGRREDLGEYWEERVASPSQERTIRSEAGEGEATTLSDVSLGGEGALRR